MSVVVNLCSTCCHVPYFLISLNSGKCDLTFAFYFCTEITNEFVVQPV